jgi:hypothetical protein
MEVTPMVVEMRPVVGVTIAVAITAAMEHGSRAVVASTAEHGRRAKTAAVKRRAAASEAATSKAAATAAETAAVAAVTNFGRQPVGGMFR